MASIHFCNDPGSAQAVLKSGEQAWRVYGVGSTAFDNVKISEDLVPKEPFDLLLVHPDTFSMEQTHKDTLRALSLINKRTIIIAPNKDENHEVVTMDIDKFMQNGSNGFEATYYLNGVLRSDFLGLMKNCVRFITNSSSALYELPYFDASKWINVGKRNADRKPLTTITPGASQRIARILKELIIDEKLLRKTFNYW
jgi:UDP-N-acetylglucosamine 2-epimerase